MHPIYFAHGYREREAPFTAYFGSLLHQCGFIPSLDPPSNDVNAAKLERHLGYTCGLVAVLSNRPEGVSQHILFEISMCLRARKPLLIFIEDSIPGDIVPRQILQRRFSARSYVRETREHIHAVQILRTYIGDNPVPKYQPSTNQRSCIIIGIEILGDDYRNDITSLLKRRGYKPWFLSDDNIPLIGSGDVHLEISNCSLAICLIDNQTEKVAYALGATQAALVPTIQLSTNPAFPLHPNVPTEYQRRLIPASDINNGITIIETQVERFEEDFIELDTEGMATQYASLLAESSSPTGQYSHQTRSIIINEFIAGNKFIQEYGIQGGQVYSQSAVFTEVWNEYKNTINLQTLSEELSKLLEQLKQSANDPEHGLEFQAVKNAESAARDGNGPRTLQWLTKTGKWTFDTATRIGVLVAAEAIKAAWLGGLT